jgi:magnesium transporter
MIRALYRTEDGRLHTDLRPDEFTAALRDTQGSLWVDISCESVETCEPILRGTFGFHPLAVDDALEETHVPKVDDWEQYLYLVLHAFVFDQQADKWLETLELDVFLGPNYLVSIKRAPSPPSIVSGWLTSEMDVTCRGGRLICCTSWPTSW